MQAAIARRIILIPRRGKAKAKAKEKAKRVKRIKPMAVIRPAKAAGKIKITKIKIVDPRALRAETKIKRERKEEKARKAKAKGKATRPDLSHQVAGQPSAINGTKTNALIAHANSTILRTAKSGLRGGVTTATNAGSDISPICERRGERM